MNIYIVTRKSDGTEVFRYTAPAEIEWTGYEFATHDHTKQAEEVVEQPPSAALEWTSFEFLRRFEANERIAARIRAKTDPVLEDFFELLLNAPIVRSDDPDVVGGLNYLTTLGILSSARVNEILRGA